MTTVDLRPQAPHTAGHKRRIKPSVIVSVLILSIAAVIVVAPIVWALSTSLRTPATSFNLPPCWIPTHPRWSNYKSVFDQIPLGTFILNSVVVTGSIVLLQLITSTMSGYAFAMVRFRGSKALFALILATMMVPLQNHHHPGIPAHQISRTQRQPRSADPARRRQRVRHVSDAAILPADAT